MSKAYVLGGVVAALILTIPNASARDLWLVAWSGDVAFFVDADTMAAAQKGVREAWVDQYGVSTSNSVYLERRSLRAEDCKKNRTRFLESVEYNPDGSVLVVLPASDEWKRVIPATVGEGVHKFVCASADEQVQLGIRVVPADAPQWALKMMQEARAN